jgi:putative Mg2+ transporter-C (MgtC) family protein
LVGYLVTGVAFLGAGTIFRGGRDNYIQGLTAAASILLVSGIGMAVALNEFILAGGVTFLALMILRGLWIIEQRRGKNRQP